MKPEYTHARLQDIRRTAFEMPKVLLLLETNFAYGASVYMQILYFLRKEISKDTMLKQIQIVFATPVYMWNEHIEERLAAVKRERLHITTLEESLAKARETFKAVWKNRPIGVGNKETLIKKVQEAHQKLLQDEYDKPLLSDTEIRALIQGEVTTLVVQYEQSSKQTPQKLLEFRKYMLTEVLDALVDEQGLVVRLQLARRTVQRMNAEMRPRAFSADEEKIPGPQPC